MVQQITEVHGRGVVGTPKTRRGTRVVALDPRTVDALHRHRATQELERAAWGPRWNDANLVFTREDGLPLRPEYATRHFMALVSRWAYLGSACMTCGTLTRPSPWRLESR